MNMLLLSGCWHERDAGCGAEPIVPHACRAQLDTGLALQCHVSGAFRDPVFYLGEGIAMMNATIQRALLILGLAVSAAAARADDPPAAAKTHALVGTWKMVSAKYGGQERDLPSEMTTIKHVTPSQFMWASYDKDGKVTRAAGGSYSVRGENYEEIPEYGISSDFDLIKGNAQTFKWKVEGNKWHHNGKLSNGLTIEEVWERIENK
jgi:hypothetical protein